MIFSENRYPPRIKSGAGFSGSCSYTIAGECLQEGKFAQLCRESNGDFGPKRGTAHKLPAAPRFPSFA